MKCAVTLNSILQRVTRPVDLSEEGVHALVGVRLNGKGPFLRELKPGTAIKKKRHYVLSSGDVVYNKLFAWRGAFGIVEESLQGCFVSDKFPTYRIITEAVLPEYLALVFRAQSLARQAEVRSAGLAAMSKFTLNPPRFGELSFWLPSLAEQQRLVRLCCELDAEAERAASQSSRINALIHSLPPALIEELSASAPRRRLGELGDITRRPVKIEDHVIYRQVTVAMSNRGVRLRGELPGAAIGVKQQAIARVGDIVFSRIDLRNGAIGVIPQSLDGAIVSNDFPVFVPSSELNGDYANLIFRTSNFRSQVAQRSAGSTNRRKIRRDSFLEIDIPVPRLEEQKALVTRVSALMAEAGAAAAHASAAFDYATALIQSCLDSLAPWPGTDA